MKDRILWLDNLKGFLIFIVVLGHTILFTNTNGDSNIIYTYISSFWMALFMFTSGFASYKTNLNYNIIGRRFKQLIIPFVCWSVILCIINGNINIINLLLYPSKSVWFLWALFWINTIIFIVCKISKLLNLPEEKLCLAIIMLSFLFVRYIENNSLLAIDLITIHLLNYSVGYFTRKHFDDIQKKPTIIWYVGGFLFLIMAYYNRHDYMPFGLPLNLHILYSILCGLLSFMFFVPIFITKKLTYNFWSKWGGETLGIYVVHIAIYTLLFQIFQTLCVDIFGFLYVLYVLTLTIIIFSISLFLSRLLGRINFLSKLLLGK